MQTLCETLRRGFSEPIKDEYFLPYGEHIWCSVEEIEDHGESLCTRCISCYSPCTVRVGDPLMTANNVVRLQY